MLPLAAVMSFNGGTHGLLPQLMRREDSHCMFRQHEVGSPKEGFAAVVLLLTTALSFNSAQAVTVSLLGASMAKIGNLHCPSESVFGRRGMKCSPRHQGYQLALQASRVLSVWAGKFPGTLISVGFVHCLLQWPSRPCMYSVRGFGFCCCYG